MGSKLILRNNLDNEFTIEHQDGLQNKLIKSNDIAVAVDGVDDFPSVANTGDVVIVRDMNRGGTFIYDATKSAENNGGTIFDGWTRLNTYLKNTTLKTHLDSYVGLVNELFTDNGTRFYLMPKSTVTTGVGGALKIFGDPYHESQANYRDLGLYFAADQSSEVGVNGTGVFWVNSKVAGSYSNNNPDIAFCFQDATAIGGRFSYNGTSIGFTVGQNDGRLQIYHGR